MAEKTKKAKKVYVLSDDSEVTSLPQDPTTVDRLDYRFENGNTHSLKIEDFPENIRLACSWHGLSQKTGDGYASSASVDEAEESFLALVEMLQGGEWTTRRVGAGEAVPSALFEAIVRLKESKEGPLSEERKAQIKDKLKDKAMRDGAREDAEIEAEYQAVLAERAQEKARKAREKATGGEGVGAGLANF